MSNYSNQDPHLISIFEVLGAYVVDTVFNHVHHSATVRRSGEASLTDEYVRHIQAYVTGVKNDEHCYGDVIQGIHKYFINTTRYTTLSFADFVDRVVSVCVPAEYYRQFAVQDKDELLSSIVCDLVSNLAAYATTPEMLHRIIDEHTASTSVTIRMLQDYALKTLLSKRADITNKFLKRMGQAREHVSMATVDDMKKVLRRLVKEKAEAVARAEDAEAALEEADATIEDLETQLEKAKARERKALQLVSLLRSGKELGPEVAGTALVIPKRETIAEPSKNGRRHGVIPPREAIAEPRHRGPAPKESKAPIAGGVPASFFKIANTDKQPSAVPASSSAKFTNLLDDVVDAGDSGEGFDGDILKDYY
jgi:hypothetical protein